MVGLWGSDNVLQRLFNPGVGVEAPPVLRPLLCEDYFAKGSHSRPVGRSPPVGYIPSGGLRHRPGSGNGGVVVGNWSRRLRGALGPGLTWGFAWFAAGMALLLVVGPDTADVPFPLGFGFLGFLSVIAGLGITMPLVLGPLFGFAGAACAAGTLALARPL